MAALGSHVSARPAHGTTEQFLALAHGADGRKEDAHHTIPSPTLSSENLTDGDASQGAKQVEGGLFYYYHL
ncbi:unnamed protein product [Bubo scandiacus]